MEEQDNLLITLYNPIETKEFLLSIGFNETTDKYITSDRWHCVVINRKDKTFTVLDANAFMKHVFDDRNYFKKYKSIHGIEELSELNDAPVETDAPAETTTTTTEETTETVAATPAPKKKRTTKKKTTETKTEE